MEAVPGHVIQEVVATSPEVDEDHYDYANPVGILVFLIVIMFKSKLLLQELTGQFCKSSVSKSNSTIIC